MLPRIDLTRSACVLAVLWGLALFVFRGWPQIDLDVTGLFWDGAAGFDILQNPLWDWLRNGMWNLEIAVFGVALVSGLLAVRRGRAVLGMAARGWAFVCLLFLLGPGLVVNGLFKSFAGRARPVNVAEFGGTATFTPAGTFSDQCDRNCSFPSGEVSSVVALAVTLWLVSSVWPLRAGQRLALRVAAVAATVFMMVHRIVEGRHFLSDTIFAILMVLTLAWLLDVLLTRGQGRDARI